MTDSGPYAYGPKVWDKIADETGIDRNACKALVYAMIYGGPVPHVCKSFGLDMMKIVEIRTTFDDIMEGRIEL